MDGFEKISNYKSNFQSFLPILNIFESFIKWNTLKKIEEKIPFLRTDRQQVYKIQNSL